MCAPSSCVCTLMLPADSLIGPAPADCLYKLPSSAAFAWARAVALCESATEGRATAFAVCARMHTPTHATPNNTQHRHPPPAHLFHEIVDIHGAGGRSAANNHRFKELAELARYDTYP